MKIRVLLSLLAATTTQAATTVYDCSNNQVHAQLIVSSQSPVGAPDVLLVQDQITQRYIAKVKVNPDPWAKSTAKYQLVNGFAGNTSQYQVKFAVYRTKSTAPTGCTPQDPWCGGGGYAGSADVAVLAFRTTSNQQRTYRLSCRTSDPWSGGFYPSTPLPPYGHRP